MGKDAGTKCSHCGKNGHNARTCGAGAASKTIKIFGVKICQNKKEDPMVKSFSMGNLQAILSEHVDDDREYLSDGPVRSRKEAHERKKGIPWTAEEHQVFLEGLKKLGKGDWRGISKSFVTTRTPTQVASHAQKYFLRQTSSNKKKRRSSLFDMAMKDTGEASKSSPLPSNESDDIPKQTTPSAQVANQVASHGAQAPPALHIPNTQSILRFNGTPYTVRNLGGQIGFLKPGGFPTVPVVPVANICNAGYGYQSSKQPNSFTAYPPFASQSYITRFSTPAAPQFVRVEPRGSSTVNTELKLSIATPDVGDRAKLLTHATIMNGAIGVI